MALRQKSDATAVGREFVDRLSGDEGITRLAVREVQGRVELYVVTADLDGDGERRLFSILVDVMDVFPDIPVDLCVLNPRFYQPDVDLLRRIPDDARTIPLDA